MSCCSGGEEEEATAAGAASEDVADAGGVSVSIIEKLD